jgi:hypothetical protein
MTACTMSSGSAATISVLIAPGTTQLTVIALAAVSRASALVRPNWPDLAAA